MDFSKNSKSNISTEKKNLFVKKIKQIIRNIEKIKICTLLFYRFHFCNKKN